MPPQSVEVAETIAALKRALRREKEAPSNQQITSGTNRGNKLKKGAAFVHSGSLPYRYSQHGYRERIEHAGYQRYILNRNPKRFNEYGDELDDSESDEEADADAEDENPYSDIRLQELLRPLTHPAELENHPTLSQPYLDTALPDMVKTTEEKLRQERANLWRAKNLHRHFIGDESWVPSENVEQSEDWDLFEPLSNETTKPSPGKKRKRDEVLENGVNGLDHAETTQEEDTMQVDAGIPNGKSESDTKTAQTEDAVTSGIEADNAEGSNIVDAKLRDATAKENGVDVYDAVTAGTTLDGTTAEEQKASADGETDGVTAEEGPEPRNEEGTDADAEESPAPPPPRRITRALAANNTSTTGTPPLSPISSVTSTIDSTLFQPHPIFLLPASIQIAHSTHQASNLPLHVAHSGLAVDEILETRRLLGMYIQKQEETIRGLEGVLGKLIKAKRMRDQVWEWTKAEGHVGEWSDGEDWVDVDAWGITAAELRKGKDEDNNEEEEIGRKGKRRRGRERD